MSLFVQSKKTYASELDGEICLFYSENTEYYILNKSGSKLWKMLDSPKGLEELLKNMQNIYQVSEKDCLLGIKSFLQDAVKKGIIKEKTD